MMSSPAAATSNLPAPLTRFVGREAELARASALLAGARLLTLTGPGGAGKTRLALRLASAVARDYPDGVWFVDLSPLSGGDFLWDQLAMTLAVKEPGPGRTQQEAVGRYLVQRQALVVLDNCEHVVESAAEVTASLLAAAPAVKVVATSREALAVGGEVTWSVPPLSELDAVQLFRDRARQVRPEVAFEADDEGAVLAICRQLDGLPLAIEFASARARAFTPAQISAHLKNRLRALPTGPRTAPARQATLQASFDWSYELLTDAERALLRQLSVFAGGCDLDAALAVCPSASAEVLAALVDRSLLLVQDDRKRGEPRYRMLETIREFAAEHLAEAGEVDLLRARHRDYYLAWVEAGEAQLGGPDQVTWFARLRVEQDNLRAGLAWSGDHEEADALGRMVVALAQFWMDTVRLTDIQMWLGAAADRAIYVTPRVRARIRNLECFLAIFTRRSLGEVPAMANEALALARAAGDKREEANALFILGLMAGLAGGAEAMRPYLEEALPLARSVGFTVGTVRFLFYFINLRLFQSAPEEPRRLAEEAIAAAKGAGRSSHHLLAVTGAAGTIALLQGRLADAAQLFETAVADGRETNDFNVAFCLIGLAWVAMLRGDFTGARMRVAEGLAAAQETEMPTVAMIDPAARWLLGWIELAGGRASQSRELLAGMVDVVRSSLLSRYAALPLLVLADAQVALGAHDEASASLEEAASRARSGSLTWILGRASQVQAKLHASKGEVHEAESQAHESLRLGREAGDQLGLVDALELLARLAADQGSSGKAVRLWAAAESLRAELGYRFSTDGAANNAAVARTRKAVGPDEFAAPWDEGSKLSADDAIAYAARGRGERKRPVAGWASLTQSELEVVRLVGQHLSNPEVAARLFVSRATVKTHLVHIFAKLGIDSRSELVAEAVRRGIQPQPSQRS